LYYDAALAGNETKTVELNLRLLPNDLIQIHTLRQTSASTSLGQNKHDCSLSAFRRAPIRLLVVRLCVPFCRVIDRIYLTQLPVPFPFTPARFSRITHPRMIRALMVIIDPAATWERIEKEQHGSLRIFVMSTLPLLLIASAIESYGLMTWGRERGMSNKASPVPMDVLMRYEAAQFVFSFALLFVGAWLVKLIAEGFHRRHSYTQAFVTTAYSLGPMFLCRALNAIPGINPWITWGIGIFLAAAALYRGLPRIMKPDPSSALGLYIMTALVYILASGLANFLAIRVLDEKILADVTFSLPL
jgi:hypothetical protein